MSFTRNNQRYPHLTQRAFNAIISVVSYWMIVSKLHGLSTSFVGNHVTPCFSIVGKTDKVNTLNLIARRQFRRGSLWQKRSIIPY